MYLEYLGKLSEISRFRDERQRNTLSGSSEIGSWQMSRISARQKRQTRPGIGMVFAWRETRTGSGTSPATRFIYNAIFLLNGTSFDIAIEKPRPAVFPIEGARARARNVGRTDKNRIKCPTVRPSRTSTNENTHC